MRESTDRTWSCFFGFHDWYDYETIEMPYIEAGFVYDDIVRKHFSSVCLRCGKVRDMRKEAERRKKILEQQNQREEARKRKAFKLLGRTEG